VSVSWWCRYAWLPGGPAESVRIVADDAGVITSVTPDAAAEDGDTHLDGFVLPGLANTHSHAFHRALRGRTHTDGGTFWTWRDRMYTLADRLDPDTYLELATAVYAEMALSGITCVGEFHYLHHGAGGARYADPNAMGLALREAARAAGIRLTLLDTVYLTGGIEVPLEGVQRRFDDGDAENWADRVSMMDDDETFRVGAAIHSVRAVPADQLDTIVTAVDGTPPEDGTTTGVRPIHVHLSEQPAENRSCEAAYGCSPTQLLADHGVLGSATTAVHATHVSAADIALLGSSGTTICVCPTTERDLADGIGPARALADAGAPLALGTDQHVLIDMLAEGRGLEMHERLLSGQRGRFTVGEVVSAMSPAGHAALGWPEAGHLAVGSLCDLVSFDLASLRTAGCLPVEVPLVAASMDVTTVVVAGRALVAEGRHLLLDRGRAPRVPERMARAVAAAWGQP
jgi:formiminoglutamate deiminase